MALGSCLLPFLKLYSPLSIAYSPLSWSLPTHIEGGSIPDFWFYSEIIRHGFSNMLIIPTKTQAYNFVRFATLFFTFPLPLFSN
ncbi:hypothetical protein [Moorena producens]|uniref:hypothetical protein n=1 Tax=Moorena producens TaxID=1155739 RepID=UPI0011EA6942|nr:hypothetical protein [Moorena producens]